MTDTDTNPLSDAQRLAIQKQHRGRELRYGTWRNFCCGCGIVLVIHVPEKRYASDLLCPDCAAEPARRNAE